MFSHFQGASLNIHVFDTDIADLLGGSTIASITDDEWLKRERWYVALGYCVNQCSTVDVSPIELPSDIQGFHKAFYVSVRELNGVCIIDRGEQGLPFDRINVHMMPYQSGQIASARFNELYGTSKYYPSLTF